MNKLPLYLTIVATLGTVFGIWAIWYYLSPRFLDVGYQPVQPVMFSHQLHAGQLGMDCRYCHSTVEKSAFASLPSTATCMGCHNKVLPNSPRLAPVRDSFKNNTPIPWVHVYSLARFAHFDHSAHVQKGVACVTCHGRVDTMVQVTQATPMSMAWCLDCHRNYNRFLRPPSQVTNMNYVPENSTVSSFDFNQPFLGDTWWSKPSPIIPANMPLHPDVQPPQACGACHY